MLQQMLGLPRAITSYELSLHAAAPSPSDVGAAPILRWAGSKRRLIKRLSEYWSDTYTRYVEPFAGSACLFFYLAPERALLGDINAHLVDTLEQVKSSPTAVSAALKGMRRGKETYYILRDLDPASLTPTQRAARFIYLNRFCFNGLYRTNRRGVFNVPYGGNKTGPLPSAEAIALCSNLLKRAELVCGDFENVLTQVRADDFVYLDPPFSVRTRRIFNEYDALTFGLGDLKRLRSWLERLAWQGTHFLISYADSKEARELAHGFHTRVVKVRRSIAGFVSKRASARELLISSHALKRH
jgi:DNA adenine methylase